jgi:hypothetical protein
VSGGEGLQQSLIIQRRKGKLPIERGKVLNKSMHADQPKTSFIGIKLDAQQSFSG